MATISTFVDDLDGTESSADVNVETVEWVAMLLDDTGAFTATTYGIDLTDENADKLAEAQKKAQAAADKAMRKELGKYIAASRVMRRQGPRAIGEGSGQTGNSTAERAENRKVREWARGQGIDVNDRGRIPAEVTAKYWAAKGQTAGSSGAEDTDNEDQGEEIEEQANA